MAVQNYAELLIVKGLAVEHEYHGKGVVLSASPEGTYVAVQYSNKFLKTYSRTHRCSELKAI